MCLIVWFIDTRKVSLAHFTLSGRLKFQVIDLIASESPAHSFQIVMLIFTAHSYLFRYHVNVLQLLTFRVVKSLKRILSSLVVPTRLVVMVA